jgi:hypothetical protein
MKRMTLLYDINGFCCNIYVRFKFICMTTRELWIMCSWCFFLRILSLKGSGSCNLMGERYWGVCFEGYPFVLFFIIKLK